MNMNSNSKAKATTAPAAGGVGHYHHRPAIPQQSRAIRRKGSSVAVPQAELSSAISFLGETAVHQACDLLLRQSEELFGSETVEQPARNDQQATYAHKMSQLYEKCKSAYDIVVRADELGMLSGAGGHPGHPSLPIRRTHAISSGVASSMPPPPSRVSSFSGGRHQGSSGGVSSSGSKTPSLFHRKSMSMQCGSSGGNRTKMLSRSNSNVSDTSADPKNEPPPPPEVEAFLKALNSGSSRGNDSSVGANSDKMGNQRKPFTAPVRSPQSSKNTHKKRKSIGSIPPPTPPPRQHNPSPSAKKETGSSPSSNLTHSPRTFQSKSNPKDKSSQTPLLAKTDAFLTNSGKVIPQSKAGVFQKTSEVADATRQTSTTPEQKSTRSRRPSPPSMHGRSPGENMCGTYGIGESVFVRACLGGSGARPRGAIVKNVGYATEENGDEKGCVMYEIEYSDGEEACIGPKNMFKRDDD